METHADHLTWSRGEHPATHIKPDSMNSPQISDTRNGWLHTPSEESPSRSNGNWTQALPSQPELPRSIPTVPSQHRLPPMRLPEGIDEAHYYNIDTKIEPCDRMLCWPKHENDHHWARYVRNSNGMQRGFAVSPSDHGPQETSQEPVSASTEISYRSSQSSQPQHQSDTPLTTMDDEENKDLYAAQCLDSMSRRRSNDPPSSRPISPERRQSRQLPPPAPTSFSCASSRGLLPVSRAPSLPTGDPTQSASIVRPHLQPIDTNTRGHAPHLSSFTSHHAHQNPNLPSIHSTVNNRRTSENVSPNTLHPPLNQYFPSSLPSPPVYQPLASPYSQTFTPFSSVFSQPAPPQASASPQAFAGFTQTFLADSHNEMATSRPIRHLDGTSPPSVTTGPIRTSRLPSRRPNPYDRPPAVTASRNVTTLHSHMPRRPNNPYTKWPQTHHESGTGEKWHSYNCYEALCDQNDSVPPRKTISQFFGRNKQQTLKIPDGVIPMLCRKCYQQKSYRSKQQHNFYEIQRDLVLTALDRAETWPGSRDWCITTSKTLQRALREHSKRIMEGESTANVSDKYSEAALDWLNENFVQLQGEHKTTEDCKTVVNLIANGCKSMRIELLPDFELLPMGDWPEFPPYLWPSNIQLRGNTPGAPTGTDPSASTASNMSPLAPYVLRSPMFSNSTSIARASSIDTQGGFARPVSHLT